MSRAAQWIAGLVGSGLAHGVFAGIYLATRTLEPAPQQQGPQSKLELATFAAPTEEAQEQTPESETAEQAQADSTAVGAGSIAQSSATPLATPSAQAQQVENPAQRAQALAPQGASVDASPTQASAPATPLSATPEAVAAVTPKTAPAPSLALQTNAAAAVVPQVIQTLAQPVETASAVLAVIPDVAVAAPAALEVQTATAAAPSAQTAPIAEPNIQVAALSVPTAEPISQAIPKAEVIAVAAPAPQRTVLSVPKIEVAKPAVPNAQSAPTASPEIQTAAVSVPDTQTASETTPQGQAVAQTAPQIQVAALTAPDAQTAPPAPTNAPTATPAALPATSAKADTALQFGDRLVTDPKALATIQAFMAPETLEGSDQVRDDLGSVLTNVDCARLSAVFIPETGTLEMRGHVPDLALRGDVIAAMQQQVGSDIPVTANLLHLPSPQCGALTGISDIGLPQSTDQFTNTRLIGETAHAREYGYTEGQRLEFDLAAPDYDAYVYVDYFTATGDVVHLVPNETIPLEKTTAKTAFGVGKDRPGKPGMLITIGPPFGQEIAVAFAASHSLYDGLRPLVEPAAPYLEDLKSRVAAARAQNPDFKGEWVYFFITTSPR